MVQYAIRNGANIMDQTHPYNGSLTAEQFLFYEIRIAAKYYVSGLKIDEAIERIKKNIQQRDKFPVWQELVISGWTRSATISLFTSLPLHQMRLQSRSIYTR